MPGDPDLSGLHALQAPYVSDRPAIARAAAAIDAGEDAWIIPPRGWIMGRSLCRQFLSSLIGSGGAGKTSLRIAQALAICTGRELTGEHVHRRGRVLIVSLEDDLDELRRRVRAACVHHRVDRQEIAGRLFFAAPIGLKIAITDAGTAEVIAGPLCDFIRQEVERRQIDVVMIDPFVKTHDVEENANGAIDKVTTILTRLAIDLNIALDVTHHTSKGPADPGNADKGRGASAFRDGARLVYTLSEMTPDEAKTFNIGHDERRSLVRLDSAKVNIAPKAVSAKWFKLVPVAIDNATDDYPNGDSVGVIERWVPPDIWRELPIPTANRVLDQIDAGMPDGAQYSSSSAAKTRAAWPLVKAAAPALSDDQCRAVIAEWLENRVLVIEKYKNGTTRKDEQGLRVIPANRPR